MGKPVCPGCDEIVKGDEVVFKRRTWHKACFEVSSAPTYCFGIMYEDNETACFSCGDSL